METLVLACIEAINSLMDIRYYITLVKAGKHLGFVLTISKEDCPHLMGLHYLTDRKDRRSRTEIYDDLMNSEEYRKWIASSDNWDEALKNRVSCTKKLEALLDDNETVFRYNPKRNCFYSKIQAEYLLENSTENQVVFLFIDKRSDTDERFCRSVFTKSDKDYSERQERWTLLYKKKEYISEGRTEELYRHKSYDP